MFFQVSKQTVYLPITPSSDLLVPKLWVKALNNRADPVEGSIGKDQRPSLGIHKPTVTILSPAENRLRQQFFQKIGRGGKLLSHKGGII